MKEPEFISRVDCHTGMRRIWRNPKFVPPVRNRVVRGVLYVVRAIALLAVGVVGIGLCVAFWDYVVRDGQ